MISVLWGVISNSLRIFQLLATLNIFINWDSLHARLNSHYEVYSYKKKKHKKTKT